MRHALVPLSRCEIPLPILGGTFEVAVRISCQLDALSQINAAVDVEDVAGDVGGFVAGEENDGGGDVLASAHASERNAYLQFFLHFVGKDGGHGRLDETWGHGVNSDIARRNFNGDGLGEAD